MARGRLYTGTSGFAYKEWKPEFYPADLKSTDMLRFYAERVPSVEINNTFYRAPTPKLLDSWEAQTPERFIFTLKAPQKITHIARLRDVSDNLEYFLGTARGLGPRLGCILFQCPPSLRYSAELLDGFLVGLPGEPFRFAMEFRHPSWTQDEVRRKLAAAGVAWCVAEDEERETAMVRTARSFVYLRLRKPRYEETELDRWAGELGGVLDEGADAYVYFKHEDDPSGVRYALRLLELV